jgi:hypothetical protein
MQSGEQTQRHWGQLRPTRSRSTPRDPARSDRDRSGRGPGGRSNPVSSTGSSCKNRAWLTFGVLPRGALRVQIHWMARKWSIPGQRHFQRTCDHPLICTPWIDRAPPVAVSLGARSLSRIVIRASVGVRSELVSLVHPKKCNSAVVAIEFHAGRHSPHCRVLFRIAWKEHSTALRPAGSRSSSHRHATLDGRPNWHAEHRREGEIQAGRRRQNRHPQSRAQGGDATCGDGCPRAWRPGPDR